MNDEEIAVDNNLAFFSLFFIAIFADIFLFATASDVRYAIFIITWIIVGRKMRFKSDATFKLTLVLLASLFLFFIFDSKSPITERIATWIYLFLWVGVIQQLLEFRKLHKKSSS